MIRSSAFLAFLVLFCLCPGCKSPELVLGDEGELTGRVYVLGNEPFTRLALEIEEESRIVLLCPPEVDQYLRGAQGKRVKVRYNGTKKVPEGQAVQVTTAELMTQ